MEKVFETLGEILKPDTKTEKEKLRDKIISNLKDIDPEDSIMCAGIHAAIQHEFNFENCIKMITDQWNDNNQGMEYCIGAITMQLILQYNKL